jgi:hypothetical protein
MPAEKETRLSSASEDSADITALLERIEGEQIPERLLTLARELQNALNLRKRQLAGPGKH